MTFCDQINHTLSWQTLSCYADGDLKILTSYLNSVES